MKCLIDRVDDTGKKILEERPRVNDETWNREKMLALPQGTFGH
jgi:ubiquinone biosynthesis protein Coq4